MIGLSRRKTEVRGCAVLAVVALLCPALPALGATFGTVVASGAAYSDIVLDQARSQIYLVNSPANQIAIYSLKQRVFLTSISTHTQPVSAAMSLDGHFLYVTSYTSALLDVIDLDLGALSNSVSLPSSPEGVAVGGDGRVLITAVPVAAGTTTDTLLIYDPVIQNVQSVPITPPAPSAPTLPPPSGRLFNSYGSRLITTADRKFIIGANGISTTGKVVFVYQVASGTVLRSRGVTNLSNTLSVSPDGSEFMAGSILFDAQTLQVIAQENAANAPFTFPAGAAGNFSTELNQGGSIFSPDGSVLYAAFNMAPPGATRANVTQLLLNDPANLLITLGLQLPENLTGKMVIDSSGANVYALSESGFTILPVGTATSSAVAQPRSRSVLLISDVCGVNASQATFSDVIDNLGKARFTVTVVPPAAAGGTGLPSASVFNTATASSVTFRVNSGAASNPGTIGPSDFIIESPEAINIPGVVHVYSNNRAPETVGNIFPVDRNAIASEGLTDILLDSIRQRVYIANSGLNRIEVFDLKQRVFLAPVKVGQLPHSMALSQDGVSLFVGNTGGESISVVDLDKLIQTGRIVFPALPFNASVPIVTPQTIAASIRGPRFVMSDGSLWNVIGLQASPRTLNPAIFGATARVIPGGTPASWSMAATPGGENILLLAGTGVAYLYNDSIDDFTIAKQVLPAPLTGYVGTVTAGPKGSYYAVGGTILNATLTQTAGGTGSLAPSGRLVGAMTAVSATQLAEFTVPVRASLTATVADAGEIEFYNPATGASQGAPAPAIEGPPSTIVGTARTQTFARTLAVDATGQNAYALTVSGLSIISLQNATNASLRPSINPGGVVSLGDYTSPVAAGGLVTIFGRNLGTTSTASAPFPVLMGGSCVTLNNQPIPLIYLNPDNIDAQIPVGLAAGRYPLVVRSIANQSASTVTNVTVSKYAPAVMMIGTTPAIFHLDGGLVSADNPANRDEPLVIYATGLGPTHGGQVITGQPSPASPLAVTDPVSLYFGNPLYKQAGIIVDWSGLAPGVVGVYQINARVPGFHISGDALPVTIKVGGVSSATVGPDPPFIAVN